MYGDISRQCYKKENSGLKEQLDGVRISLNTETCSGNSSQKKT